MSSDRIQKIQTRIGVSPDGFWGPKSIAACKKHLLALMPAVNPWPAQGQAALAKFYGAAGDESNLVSIMFPFPTKYEGKIVKTTRVNKKCADSLLRVLNSIYKKYSGDAEIMKVISNYSGAFEFRNKRGGTSYSLHAYGAAIDYDAEFNAFKDHWPVAATMPIEIMEEFAREGWVGLGWLCSSDPMHFQATKPW